MNAMRLLGSLTLLMTGFSFAGVPYDKIVVPEPVCGPWYVSVFGGGSFYDDDRLLTESLETGSPPERELLDFDNGWILGAAVGFRTDANWRFELELHHHNAPADEFTLSLNGNPFGSPAPLFGDVETTSLMFNAVKEFGFGRLRPYLGGGLGLSSVELFLLDNVAGVGRMNADETVFGYQAMGGLVYDVTDCLQGYLEYRLTGHGDLEDVSFTRFTGPSSLDLGWSQHVLLGLRYYF